MKKVSEFTDKFKNITPPDDCIRHAVARAVLDALGIRLDVKNIRIRNAVAHITADATVRSEIFIRKNGILDALNAELGEKQLRDIR